VALAILVSRCLLALVLLVAAAAKLLDRAGSARALREFGVPERLAGAGGLLLPLAEAALAAAMCVTATARAGAAGALLLLVAFAAVIAGAMRRGRAPDCHCFGQLYSEPAGKSTLIRNGALAAVAVFVLVGAPGRSLGHLSGEDVALLVLSLVAATGGGVAAALWRANRRLRAASASRRRPLVEGLPVGAPAPDLSLLTLEGDAVSLHQLIAAERPAALVQVSPKCAPCRDLLPELSRWQHSLAHGISVIPVSSGELEDNRAFAAEYGLQTLYVDVGEQLPSAFRVRPTPSAVLIDERARIAAAPAAGAVAIEALIRLALQRAEAAA
jgi:peroxiredoxin